MNDTDKLWDRSRASYTAYRDAKRGLLRIHKRHNSTYYLLENAFMKWSRTCSKAENELEKDYSAELVDVYQEFRKAKREHDASRYAFYDAFRDFKNMEISYSVVIFNGLKAVFQAKIADIAKIFGIWNSTIRNWEKGDEKALSEHYDKEFGDNNSE